MLHAGCLVRPRARARRVRIGVGVWHIHGKVSVQFLDWALRAIRQEFLGTCPLDPSGKKFWGTGIRKESATTGCNYWEPTFPVV